MSDRLKSLGVNTVWDAGELLQIRHPHLDGDPSVTADDLREIWFNLGNLMDAYLAQKIDTGNGRPREDVWDAESEATFVLSHIADHINLPDDLAWTLAKEATAAGPEPDDAITVPPGKRVAGSGLYVLSSLCSNPRITVDLLEFLATSTQGLPMVAGNPSTPPEMLLRFAESIPDADVILTQHSLISSLLRNPNTPAAAVPVIVNELVRIGTPHEFDLGEHRDSIGVLLDPEWRLAAAVDDASRSRLIVHAASL